MTGTNKYCIADRVGDEIHAAQQERAQEYLAKRGIGLHNTAQVRQH